MPSLPARSIARPLFQALRERPFYGYVMGAHERACNLIDEQERIIALVSPEVGNGPFSILLEEEGTRVFADLSPNLRVWATPHHMTLDRWHIRLDAAARWEPKLPSNHRPFHLTPAIAELLQPFLCWPSLPQNTPVDRSLTCHLSRAATALQHALATRKEVAPAAARLAGLGPGLTPAGDDYLVGVFAALWLTRPSRSRLALARAVTDKTTVLSAAYLRAASRGQFTERWHALIQALKTNDTENIKTALRRLTQWGASSGRDALAGFAATLLGKG